MDKPWELPPTIHGGVKENLEASPLTRDYHQHRWQNVGTLNHQREHVITKQPMIMVSLLLVCNCGAQCHSWVIPPPEPQADQQRVATPPLAFDPRRPQA